ncbi:MAG TPA: class I SAM-dependent methyltransferase [Marmoricola sp.]|nr:class I SAM-dependent methyltransferase [Marmoricola sp.]
MDDEASSVAATLKSFYDVEMRERATRPLGDERLHHVEAFAAAARERGCRSVLEIGCGAGRDGRLLRDAGLSYVGIDLSTQAARTCRALGLPAVEGSATRLPFASAGVDAAWSMSTLMHLPGDGFARAIDELRRVVRPGGLVEIGVWGHTEDGERTSPDGRYFRQRTDQTLRQELARLGGLLAFETWDWFEDGGHYQWTRVQVAS